MGTPQGQAASQTVVQVTGLAGEVVEVDVPTAADRTLSNHDRDCESHTTSKGSRLRKIFGVWMAGELASGWLAGEVER